MVWYELVLSILGGSGIVGAIYKLFTMRVNKESLVIDNLKQIINEVKENHKEYKQETDEKFDKLEKKIATMEMKDQLQQRAISKGYRCPFPPDGKECPVTCVVDSVCKILEENKNKKA